MTEKSFDSQFTMTPEDYSAQINIVNWLRYFYILQIAQKIKNHESHILEIGGGAGIMESLLSPDVRKYHTLDINDKLTPTYVGSVEHIHPKIAVSSYNICIIADVLEHLEFNLLGQVLTNISEYLTSDGELIVTIPHRRTDTMILLPDFVPRYLSIPKGFTPYSFYRRFVLRKTWIDPHHKWEISTQGITRNLVEQHFGQAGFNIKSYQRITYVDVWHLKKYCQ